MFSPRCPPYNSGLLHQHACGHYAMLINFAFTLPAVLPENPINLEAATTPPPQLLLLCVLLQLLLIGKLVANQAERTFIE